MDTSGSEANPGACPAQAHCTVMRAVATDSPDKMALELMLWLLAYFEVFADLAYVLNRDDDLIPERPRALMLANRQTHRRDLLMLSHDDLLGNAPKLFVSPVAQLGFRHLDCTAVVRDHHG